jgi:hypothetical protein
VPEAPELNQSLPVELSQNLPEVQKVSQQAEQRASLLVVQKVSLPPQHQKTTIRNAKTRPTASILRNVKLVKDTVTSSHTKNLWPRNVQQLVKPRDAVMTKKA